MDFTKLTDFLDSIPNLGVPGVDCIVQQGYETIYRHQAGFSDREAQIPMRGDEAFYLYSSSKPITCTAVLQLYEQGKLLLTDPLSNYIPEFRNMQVQHQRGNGEMILLPARREITIANLMSMTAGLNYDLDSPAIQEVAQRTQGRYPTVEVARALASQPLCYEPGTRWQYSLAHDVLGAVVEIVSGMRFGEYLRQNLFEPLGMVNTRFAHSNDLPANMMPQYVRNNTTGEVTLIGPANAYILGSEYESGGAGLVSTLADYSKFLAAMANGGVSAEGVRILSQNTIDLMRLNQLSGTQMEDFDWPQFAGYGYGLGVRTMVDPARGGANSPLGEFGWAGAAGTYLLIDPQNKISMFYVQHMRESLESYIHPRLRNVLYGCL